MLNEATIDSCVNKAREMILRNRNSSIPSLSGVAFSRRHARAVECIEWSVRHKINDELRYWEPGIGWHENRNRIVCHLGWLPDPFSLLCKTPIVVSKQQVLNNAFVLADAGVVVRSLHAMRHDVDLIVNRVLVVMERVING